MRCRSAEHSGRFARPSHRPSHKRYVTDVALLVAPDLPRRSTGQSEVNHNRLQLRRLARGPGPWHQSLLDYFC